MDFLIVLEDAMINSHALRFVDGALKRRIPAIFGPSGFVAAGGFIAYGPSLPDWPGAPRLSWTRF